MVWCLFVGGWIDVVCVGDGCGVWLGFYDVCWVFVDCWYCWIFC